MKFIRRGEPDYERARRGATWNGRDYGRYPDVIVKARTTEGVIAAVKLAKAESLKTGIRSGGHSWSGNYVRDGGMLLDLYQMKGISIDAASMTATAEPGCDGAVFGLELARMGRMLPTGHCWGVGLGGFLLQGGYGWYSRELGPACESMLGIEYVATPAKPRTRTQVLLAHLQAAALRRHVDGLLSRAQSRGGHPLAAQGRARGCSGPRGAPVAAFSPSSRNSVELMAFISRKVPGVKGPGIMIITSVYADSWREARKAHAFIKSRPRGARIRLPVIPFKQIWMTRLVNSNYPDNHCYAADNMWTPTS